MPKVPKPKVVNLGSYVVERDGKAFLVMRPDGSVKGFACYVAAIKSIKKDASKRTPKDSIGVCKVTSYDGYSAPLMIDEQGVVHGSVI